jgi:uncharacterized protein
VAPKQADFRFYAELNDFLPSERRFRSLSRTFAPGASVKDAIEAFGVPHTEVDVILVNGESVDFSYSLRPGDRVSVYPVFESLDIASVSHVRPKPLRDPRFVLDAHLGQLARYLRMLGFDSLFERDRADVELIAISTGDRRTLLTRDLGVLKRRAVTHGYYVRETSPRAQLIEVVRRFDLFGSMAPFTRCVNCNGRTRPVAKEKIADRLEPRTRRYFDEFRECEACSQIYWKGSHYDRMLEFVEVVRRAGVEGRPSASRDHA